MNLRSIHSLRGSRGFTLLEIAVALAVIGFAIVAVLGVLPTALNVQRDTRERTVVLQDANYFMEAIRRGARGTNDLASYVEALFRCRTAQGPHQGYGIQLMIPGIGVAKQVRSAQQMENILVAAKTDDLG